MLDAPIGNSHRTLILGVGNRLLSDEGVGIHIVERLVAGYRIPEEVVILDGGTLGLDLLYYLEGVENLLLIDAVEADREPGDVVRLVDDEVPSYLGMKISPHQIGIPDMLFAARLKDLYPKHVVLIGIQPAWLDVGLELSPEVEAVTPAVIEETVGLLREWGHEVSEASPTG